MFLKGREEWNI